MSPRVMKLLAAVLGLCAAIALGSTSAYLVHRSNQTDAVRSGDATSSSGSAAETFAPAPPATTPSDSPPTSGRPTTQLDDSQDDTAAPPLERTFALITAVDVLDDDITLTVDHAEYLTGAAAARAAAADGEESPPPNDFYIDNDSPRLRVLPLATTARIVIALNDPTDTRTLAPREFAEAHRAGADGVEWAVYWLTIENGIVTSIEEQWTP